MFKTALFAAMIAAVAVGQITPSTAFAADKTTIVTANGTGIDGELVRAGDGRNLELQLAGEDFAAYVFTGLSPRGAAPQKVKIAGETGDLRIHVLRCDD